MSAADGAAFYVQVAQPGGGPPQPDMVRAVQGVLAHGELLKVGRACAIEFSHVFLRQEFLSAG